MVTSYALHNPQNDRWLRVTDAGAADSPSQGGFNPGWGWERFEVHDVGNDEVAPSLVVESGATIEASGTQEAPITLTSNQQSPDSSGLWGGLTWAPDARLHQREFSHQGAPPPIM